MSAKPITSLYKYAGQQLPASFASPQYTPRLNFEESQFAMVMLMMLGNNMVKPRKVTASSRTQNARIAQLPSGIISATDVCLFPEPSTPVCCQTQRRWYQPFFIW